jgi:hypothetical protein
MVLRVVNDQICYILKNIVKSSLNFDLWVSINSLYQNMMKYNFFLFFEFSKYYFWIFKNNLENIYYFIIIIESF